MFDGAKMGETLKGYEEVVHRVSSQEVDLSNILNEFEVSLHLPKTREIRLQ